MCIIAVMKVTHVYCKFIHCYVSSTVVSSELTDIRKSVQIEIGNSVDWEYANLGPKDQKNDGEIGRFDDVCTTIIHKVK